MDEISDITKMAWSLEVVAVCSVIALLKSFGFWRWLKNGAGDWVRAWIEVALGRS